MPPPFVYTTKKRILANLVTLATCNGIFINLNTATTVRVWLVSVASEFQFDSISIITIKVWHASAPVVRATYRDQTRPTWNLATGDKLFHEQRTWTWRIANRVQDQVKARFICEPYACFHDQSSEQYLCPVIQWKVLTSTALISRMELA